MISIYSIQIFWILLIVNRIGADQCAQTSPCRCNYEDGFGYDLQGLESTKFEAVVGNTTGIEYIFQICSDSTVVPPYHPIVTNECNPGYAVRNIEVTVSELTM